MFWVRGTPVYYSKFALQVSELIRQVFLHYPTIEKKIPVAPSKVQGIVQTWVEHIQIVRHG